MATAEMLNKQFIDQKLELLEKHRGRILKSVDDYVNNAMTAAKQWTVSKEARPQFYVILQIIDSAVEVLEVMCKNISEADKKFLQSNTGNVVQQNDVDSTYDTMSSPASNEDSAINIFSSKILNWCKKQEEKLEENQKQMDKMATKLSEVQKLETEFKSIKHKFEKLSENQDELQNQVMSMEGLEEKLVNLANETEQLKDLMMTATGQNEAVLKDITARTDSLCEGHSGIRESIESVIIQQEKSEAAFQEIDQKFLQMETQFLQDLQVQFEEVDTNYKMVCQILVNRLEPLEQLRQTLNERYKTRDENVAKLQQLVKDVTTIYPKILQLESLASRPVVGFTAGAADVEHLAENSVINRYCYVYCNAGSHFDADCGVFTAPYGGIYVVSVTLMCEHKNAVLEVDAVREDSISSSESQKVVCWATVQPHMTRQCDLGLINMKVGDKLYAKVVSQGSNGVTGKTIRISCFHIG